MIFFALLFGQRMILGTLFRQERIGMQLDEPLVSCIRFQQNFRLDMNMGILEQLEIVLLPLGKGQTEDLTSVKVHQQLCL